MNSIAPIIRHPLLKTAAATATAALLLLAALPADAMNCSSVCNQIRRACNHSAKGTAKAANITCDEARDDCKDACVANAATCPGDCDAVAAACVSACGGDALCEAGCGDALTQCLSDCDNCAANCDAARGDCRTTAKAERNAKRATCTAARGTCRDVCVDPIDKVCARGCTNDEHGCRADAKSTEGLCKKACAKDGDRGRCIRTCRKSENLAEGVCEDVAVLCYADCAGVDLTPTTTLP